MWERACVARELAPARLRSSRKAFLGPLRDPAGASSLATQARSHKGLSAHKKRACICRLFFIFRIVLRLMRPRQEFVRLHLQQTTQSPLEFEIQTTAGVEVFELDFRRNDQLHVTVVELVRS